MTHEQAITDLPMSEQPGPAMGAKDKTFARPHAIAEDVLGASLPKPASALDRLGETPKLPLVRSGKSKGNNDVSHGGLLDRLPGQSRAPASTGARFVFSDDIPNYTSVQSAAMSLMASKLAASLALEGDFSAEGLAAMADSEDIASKLARVIAGQLTVEDPRIAMARYREQLAKIMPESVTVQLSTGEVKGSTPVETAPCANTLSSPSTSTPDGSPAPSPDAGPILILSGSGEGSSRTPSPRAPSAPAAGSLRPAASSSPAARPSGVSTPRPDSPGENRSKNGTGTFGPRAAQNPTAPITPRRPARCPTRSELQAAMNRLTAFLNHAEMAETAEAASLARRGA